MTAAPREKRDRGDSSHRKRRRLAGESDTDRDIRLAKDDVHQADVRRGDAALHRPHSDAPVLDDSGHISLFPAEQSKKHRDEKHPEAEAEKKRKERELEDQYTMRFSNAAGYKQKLEQPWYSSSRQDLAVQSEVMPNKDVWGNEDPRRREREKRRVDANDPLAAMKKGVRQLREVDKERKKWDDERQRELQELRREQESSGRRPAASSDSLENFQLDDDDKEGKEERWRRHRSRRPHREDRGHRSKHSRTDRSHHTRRSNAAGNKRARSPASRGADAGWTRAPCRRYSAQFAES